MFYRGFSLSRHKVWSWRLTDNNSKFKPSASRNRHLTAVTMWSTAVYFRRLDHSSIFELLNLKILKISLSDLQTAVWVTIWAVHQVIFEQANKIMNSKCAQIDKKIQRHKKMKFSSWKVPFLLRNRLIFHTFFDNWPNELHNLSNLHGLRPDSTLWPWTSSFLLSWNYLNNEHGFHLVILFESKVWKNHKLILEKMGQGGLVILMMALACQMSTFDSVTQRPTCSEWTPITPLK